MSEADGYRVTERACTVARRCSTFDGGRDNCPFSDEVDIALIHCPDRLPLQPFADTMPDNPSSGSNIEVVWYHEVVDLPTYDDGSEYWDHYGARDDDNPHSGFKPLLCDTLPQVAAAEDQFGLATHQFRATDPVGGRPIQGRP